MSSIVRVEKLDEVMRNLNERIRSVSSASRKGLIRAGLLIQREAQRRTPVDTGNLRASAFTVWTGGSNVGGEAQGRGGGRFRGTRGEQTAMEFASTAQRTASQLSTNPDKPDVMVGFGASYALFVHERPARHVVGTVKFLEKAVAENTDAIVRTVGEDVRRSR